MNIKRFFLIFISASCLISNAHCSAITKVAVFCSGDNNIAPHLKTITYKLGQYLGANHFGLMTGGFDSGLMKEVSNGYISQAVSPELLESVILEKHSSNQNIALSKVNIKLVKTLHDRLEHFYHTANIFIVLPGGFGTLHELADCLVHNQSEKLIILLNIDGFWNNLIKQFDTITTSNPAASKKIAGLIIVNTLSECTELLEEMPT